LTYVPPSTLTYTWLSTPATDMIADSIASVAMHVEQNAVAFTNAALRTELPPEEEEEAVRLILEQMFGHAESVEGDGYYVRKDDASAVARVSWATHQVEVFSQDESLKDDVRVALQRAFYSIRPLPASFPL
jgi:hypothetical protein